MPVLRQIEFELDGNAVVDLLNAAGSEQQRWATFWGDEPQRTNERRVAYQQHRTLLKDLVDEWIDSGLHADGSEAPMERCEERAPRVAEHVDLFFQTSRVERSRTGTDESVAVKVIHSAARWRTVKPGLEPGLLSVAFRRVHEIVTAILYSPARSTISKCRYCGRYFLRESSKRLVYTNGLFCNRRHNSAFAGAKRTAQRRAENDHKIVQWVAGELRRRARKGQELSGWQRDASLKKELVAIVNPLIARDPNQTREHIRVNWITAHWEEVQKAL